MIEISTAAKMKLAENRTTLFKADLILNGQYPSTVGKNLDIHANDYEGNSQITLNTGNYPIVIWGGGYGSDLSQIPMTLVNMYEYIIISGYVRHNSISVASDLAFGVRIGTSGYIFDYDSQIEVLTGEYQRFTASIKVSDLPSGNLVCAAARYSAAPPITVNIDYKQFMCELNNTGIPLDYVDSYVENGGSYDDFLTARTISLTGDDVMSGTATFSDSTSSSGSFDIGAAIINSASLTLNNYDDRFAGIDFTGASVRAYIGVPIEPVEWITKGYYTVDKPTSIGNTIPLTMLDNMSKFERPYKNVTQLYPATLYDIVHSICTYCGVALNDTSFPNSDFEIPVRPDDTNLTCLA